jgi:hypothetical protein
MESTVKTCFISQNSGYLEQVPQVLWFIGQYTVDRLFPYRQTFFTMDA